MSFCDSRVRFTAIPVKARCLYVTIHHCQPNTTIAVFVWTEYNEVVLLSLSSFHIEYPHELLTQTMHHVYALGWTKHLLCIPLIHADTDTWNGQAIFETLTACAFKVQKAMCIDPPPYVTKAYTEEVPETTLKAYTIWAHQKGYFPDPSILVYPSKEATTALYISIYIAFTHHHQIIRQFFLPHYDVCSGRRHRSFIEVCP